MDIINQIKNSAVNRPTQLAFKSQAGEIKYLQLWNKSEKIAKWIKENIGGKNPIVVYGHKSPLMITTFLACSKAGKTYCPVDRCMPSERIQDIIETVENEYVLMTESLMERFVNEELIKEDEIEQVNEYTIRYNNNNYVTVEKLIEKISNGQNEETELINEMKEKDYVKEDDIYYIIFTSGSTGKPKGVQITRSNLENYLKWFTEVGDDIHHKCGSKFLNQAPFSFDLSVMDTYVSLASGGTIISVDKKMQQDTTALISFIKENGINYWVSTPSFAAMCLAEPNFGQDTLKDLRYFYFCGETLSKDTAEKLMERFPNTKVINTYGPTESTVAVTGIEVTKTMLEDKKSIPIGYEKNGTKILILKEDEASEKITEAKANEIGELVILGDTVGAGYYKNIQKTVEAFKEITYNGKTQIAYFTGDAGYRDENEVIFYLGRIDRQVKLHGYRIELGDIESNLIKIDEVNQAAVVPKKSGDSIKQLVAFIVTEKLKEDYASRKYVREKLKTMIPEYMVPKKIVFLEKMPLTNNGKIDYKRMETLV